MEKVILKLTESASSPTIGQTKTNNPTYDLGYSPWGANVIEVVFEKPTKLGNPRQSFITPSYNHNTSYVTGSYLYYAGYYCETTVVGVMRNLEKLKLGHERKE